MLGQLSQYGNGGRRAVLACVIGSMDLVRPLGLAGIRSAVVAPPNDVVRWSRFTAAALEWADPWSEPERLLEVLVGFGRSQQEQPVLYYEGDWDLLLVSRERERLGRWFRFVVPEAELVEDLVDKERFGALAERLELPVPPGRRLLAGAAESGDIGLRFPMIVKPLTRQKVEWEPVARGAKALVVHTPAELRQVRQRLAGQGVDALAQEAVLGPETRVESYHAYVDTDGVVVGEFAGKKLRTFPPSFGASTALVITDREDVIATGRDLVERMKLRGVAKLDFKRDDAERLWLLEVNPRFNLWHHPGAKAGVNLPELVYRDLLELPRRPVPRARPGVRWVYHRHDARAARAVGIPFHRWLVWALSAEAKSTVSIDDPLPLVRGTLKHLVRAIGRALPASRAKRVRDAIAHVAHDVARKK
jgi:D-aspartate ligase